MAAAERNGRLDGKICLVSGAASGIGRGTAEVFATEGARLVLTDIDEAGLRSVAEELGDRVEAHVVADVSSEEAVAALYADAIAPLGRLDGLVCAHGLLDLEDGPLEDHKTETFDRTLRVNLYGCYFLARGAIGPMKAADSASIVFISSLAALRTPSSIAYGATKGALNAMGKTISGQYARDGIRCNVICPGAIETPMLDRMRAKHRREPPDNHVGHTGQPCDVGHLAAFLCSDESAYITAAVQTVDGGLAQH
jgi:NAD(P)-dependent dehydrogenase (short-subunit alcohol dehydrogenase family)